MDCPYRCDACDNAVLAETLPGHRDSRDGPIYARLGGCFETIASWRMTIAEHTAVCGTIKARGVEGARHAMDLHRDRSQARFSASGRRARAA